ncbi:glutamate receptor ionotropic, delta-2-like [Portunus trituberculatus]|uniref:glutamate receptor ionotropic, delta-2-like n=1 Tax=Portunus trituberculatus TaxID=210409 RepID=UPI001E1D1E8E|nr:glutamate receptor ionotropic, delta-2-like [Portunus trituberculatus]
MFLLYLIAVTAVVLATSTLCLGWEGEEVLGAKQVGSTISQMINTHVPLCYLVFLSTQPNSFILSTVKRQIMADYVTMDASASPDQLSQALQGDYTTTCRALILHLGNRDATGLVLGLLEQAGVSSLPEMWFGPWAGIPVWKMFSFIQVFATLFASSTWLFHTNSTSSESQQVSLYSRCLYCNSGKPSVFLVFRGNITALQKQQTLETFPKQFQDFHRHTLRIVACSWFPFIDFTKGSGSPGSTITLRDSLDARTLKALSSKLNFTYACIFVQLADLALVCKDKHINSEKLEETVRLIRGSPYMTHFCPFPFIFIRVMESANRYAVHAEPTGSWGIEKEGKFSGMMGQLQREESDVSTSAAPTPERNKYLELIRSYPADPMKLVSLKPSPLPHATAPVRPFSGEVWVSVVVGVVVWGVMLWLLQVTWDSVTGQRNASFITVLLYGWGALLEQPPQVPSVTVSGQMLVGWWLVYTMVIVAAFRSSFIAHLTVQSTTKPVETLEELVKQKNWGWSLEKKFFKGAVYDYFTKHTLPEVKEMMSKVEFRDTDNALERILEGGYTHIAFDKYISVIIASRYTDAQGRTPYYIGTKNIPVLVYTGLVLRKGVPFYHHFQWVINQLEDGGILAQWTAEVMAQRIKENRKKLNSSQQESKTVVSQEEKGVVLGLDHVQGGFYLLFLGCSLGLLSLLGEITHNNLKKHQ